MSDTTIHMLRHGQVANPKDIVYGRLPGFRLSETGRRQARAAADYFSGRPLSAIYCSPLLRARQTAQALKVLYPEIPIRLSKLITEIHSPFEGRPSASADRLGGDVYSNAGNGFEQPGDVLNRTLRLVRRIKKAHAGEQVAVVTHGDVIVFALLWSKGRPLDPAFKGRLGPLGIPRGYPAHASVTSLVFHSAEADGRPDVRYTEPNGTEMKLS